ncbi:uncharacterized protein LOC119568624, partial [Penaeus monodon]|uniref:uncharacterized protein LOC119568624 n=1 Tax=Penaeus monodon TaxID=6687 RepID=UPI0018A7B4AB
CGDYNLNLLHEFKAHNYAVTDILVVGHNIFTACADCTFSIWDANTFEFKRGIEGHEESIRKIKTDGKNVFAGDDKGEVRVYSSNGDFAKMDRGLPKTETKGESNKFTVINSTSEGRAPLYVTSDTLAYLDRTGMVVLIHDNTPSSHQLKGQSRWGHDRIVTALRGVGNFMVSGGWGKQQGQAVDVASFRELGSSDIPGLRQRLGCDRGQASIRRRGWGLCLQTQDFMKSMRTSKTIPMGSKRHSHRRDKCPGKLVELAPIKKGDAL